jgi:hypothetical protein
VSFNGPCTIKYSPDKPLSCGAKVWIETEAEVVCKTTSKETKDAWICSDILMNNKDVRVSDIVDHEDGSATLSLDMEPSTYHMIFEYGFRQLIMKGLEAETFPARDP